MTRHHDIANLIDILARLRDPEAGCPWDRRQTFHSLLPYTLEEAYEVAEAIEHEDSDALRDELGDLLLHVVYHARIAEELGQFAFADVVMAICAKMIRRHPHVFAGAEFHDEAAIWEHWERTKAAERRDRTRETGGTLAGVARTLPALARAAKLQRRAATVGFDWDDPAGVLAKVAEELDECRATLDSVDDFGARVHELGDLLFSCVNLARHLGVDAEQALRAANQRFERRFAQVEAGLHAAGLTPGPDTRSEMERLWDVAKRGERA